MATRRKATGKPNVSKAVNQALNTESPAPVTGSPAEEDAPRRGRPKGSRNKSRAIQTAAYVPTDSGIQMAGLLGGTIWSLVGRFAGLRELNAQESESLGRAIDPVLWKYLPMLGDWQLEVNLVITVAALVQATRIKDGDNAEAMQSQAAGDGAESDSGEDTEATD